jgi:hypothetical protein
VWVSFRGAFARVGLSHVEHVSWILSTCLPDMQIIYCQTRRRTPAAFASLLGCHMLGTAVEFLTSEICYFDVYSRI